MSQLGIEQLGEFRGLPLAGGAEEVGAGPVSVFRRGLNALLYPRHYVWVVGLAFLDIVLTSLVLSTGGHELNGLAQVAIERAGVAGMIGIKAATLAVIVAICEYIGRRRPVLGRRIVEIALAANSVAVACGLLYLVQFSLVLILWM